MRDVDFLLPKCLNFLKNTNISFSLHLQKMIARTASSLIERLALGFPVMALTGPRQSSKTTLARTVFPDKPYVSLESLDELEFAREDPKRFLGRFKEGAFIDEIQRCPSLLSSLQGRQGKHDVAHPLSAHLRTLYGL